MATSGSLSTPLVTIPDGSGTRNVIFSWSISSTTSNSTTIAWTLKGGGTNTGWVYCGDFKVGTSSGSGNLFNDSTRISVYSGTTIASGTYTINGSTNLSLTIYIQASVYYSEVKSNINTWSLPDLITADAISSISPSTPIFGSSVTINFTNNNNLYHVLWYAPINNNVQGSWVEIARDIRGVTSYAWSFPETTASNFTGSTPKIIFRLGSYKDNTYAGSVLVGTNNSSQYSVNPSSNLLPSVSPVFTDSSGYYTSNNKLLTGTSYGTINLNAEAKQGGSISSTQVKIGTSGNWTSSLPQSYSTSSNFTQITYRAIDSRGWTSDVVVNYTWENIGFTSLTAERCDSNGTASPNGTRAKVTYTATSASVGSNLTINYKNSSGTSVNQSITLTSSNLTGNIITNSDIYSSASTITVTVGSVSQQLAMSSLFIPMEIYKKGTGISFGQGAEANKFIVNNFNAIEFNKVTKIAMVNTSGIRINNKLGIQANLIDWNDGGTNGNIVIGPQGSSTNAPDLVAIAGKRIELRGWTSGTGSDAGIKLRPGYSSGSVFNFYSDGSVTGIKSIYGTGSEVTTATLAAGWTPTKDGTMSVWGQFASGQNGYIYVSCNGGGSATHYVYAGMSSSSGGTMGGSFPVHANWKYTLTYKTTAGTWETTPKGFYVPFK